MEMLVSRQAVIDAAGAIGAAAVGWSVIEDPEPSWIRREGSHLSGWQERGLFGEMAYLSPVAGRWKAGSTEFSRLKQLISGKSVETDVQSITVLSLSFPYHAVSGSFEVSKLVSIGSSASRDSQIQSGVGRIARYACGPDYHQVLPKLITAFWEQLCKSIPAEVRSALLWRSTTDIYPILERAYARNSGLGFIGKNSLLISPGIGSFTLLAELVTNLQIAGETPTPERPGKCGTCHRCKTSCPTAALQEERVVDARRCISYLTIEKRGVLAEWERRAIGDWIFGCDICQEVCPFNHNPTPGISELRDTRVHPAMLLDRVLSLRSEREFLEQFGGTPIERTRRAGLVRNAICVAVNQSCVGLFDLIHEVALTDPSPTVRATAAWGAVELAASGKSASCSAALVSEYRSRELQRPKDSEIVLQELTRLLPRVR